MIDNWFFAGDIPLYLIAYSHNAYLYIVELRQEHLYCEYALPITMHGVVAYKALPDHVVIYFHDLIPLYPKIIDEFILCVHC